MDHWYTRLGAALSNFAAIPLDINDTMLLAIAQLKPEITYAFAASGYRTTEHLIHLCSINSVGTDYSYNRNTLLLMLSMMSINDVPREVLEAAASLPPEQYFILSIGWLTERAIITELGENNRTYLIETSDKYSDIDIETTAIPPLAKVWMYCTYADTPNKHNIKITLRKEHGTYISLHNYRLWFSGLQLSLIHI